MGHATSVSSQGTPFGSYWHDAQSDTTAHAHHSGSVAVFASVLASSGGFSLVQARLAGVEAGVGLEDAWPLLSGIKVIVE